MLIEPLIFKNREIRIFDMPLESFPDYSKAFLFRFFFVYLVLIQEFFVCFGFVLLFSNGDNDFVPLTWSVQTFNLGLFR